jgi:hypothetical protein
MSLALTIPTAASAAGSKTTKREWLLAASADRTACRSFGQVDHAHLATRRHDGTDGKIAEAHDARDHFLFAGFEHAGILRFDNEVRFHPR